MQRVVLPSVARLAKLHGLKLENVKATGPKGHILKADLLPWLAPKQVTKVIAGDPLNAFIQLSRNDPDQWVRKTIKTAELLSRQSGVTVLYTVETRSVIISGGEAIVSQVVRIMQSPKLLHL